MLDILKLFPPQVWLILAVGIVGLILFIGLRILRSSKVEIDVGSVDISLDKTKPTDPAAPPPTLPSSGSVPPTSPNP